MAQGLSKTAPRVSFQHPNCPNVALGWGPQTGQYSTQIFSLAVLLSSLFVYNQMGGIDEAALDRLSLVTEMTKHIRVKAASGAALTFPESPSPDAPSLRLSHAATPAKSPWCTLSVLWGRALPAQATGITLIDGMFSSFGEVCSATDSVVLSVGVVGFLGLVGETEAELAEFTPAFLWLLRDFYLTLEEDGHQVRRGPLSPVYHRHTSLEGA